MLDAVNTIAGGVRSRRRRVIGAGADAVTVTPGQPLADALFVHLEPYNPGGQEAWVKTGTLGYYIHRGRVYLQGGVGAFNGFDPSAMILQLPAAARPTADLWKLCPVDPAVTSPPFPGEKWVRFAADGTVTVVDEDGSLNPDDDTGWAEFFGSVLFHDVSWPVNETADPGPSSTVKLEPLVPSGFQSPSDMDPGSDARIGKDGNRVHFQGTVTVVHPVSHSGNLWGPPPTDLLPGALSNEGTGTILEIPVEVEASGLWMFYIFNDGVCSYRQRFSPYVPFFAWDDHRPYRGSFGRGALTALSGDGNLMAQCSPGPLSTPDVPVGAITYALWDRLIFPGTAEDPYIPADYPYGLTDLAARRVGIFFGWAGDSQTSDLAGQTATYYKLVYVRDSDVDGVALIAVDMRPGAAQKYRLVGQPYTRGTGYGRPAICAIRQIDEVQLDDGSGAPKRTMKFTISHPSSTAFAREIIDDDADFSGHVLGDWPGRVGILEWPAGTDAITHERIEIDDPSLVLWGPGQRALLDGHGYFAAGGREPHVGHVTAAVGAGGIVPS